MLYTWCLGGQKLGTVLDLCLSSLRRGHANLLCIVPILSDDPRRESIYIYMCVCVRIYTHTQSLGFKVWGLGSKVTCQTL